MFSDFSCRCQYKKEFLTANEFVGENAAENQQYKNAPSNLDYKSDYADLHNLI